MWPLVASLLPAAIGALGAFNQNKQAQLAAMTQRAQIDEANQLQREFALRNQALQDIALENELGLQRFGGVYRDVGTPWSVKSLVRSIPDAAGLVWGGKALLDAFTGNIDSASRTAAIAGSVAQVPAFLSRLAPSYGDVARMAGQYSVPATMNYYPQMPVDQTWNVLGNLVSGGLGAYNAWNDGRRFDKLLMLNSGRVSSGRQ
jgi:type II secretory pathway pseudopilin PulG